MNHIWQDQTIYLTQRKYIVVILRCFGIAKSKLVQTPFIIRYGSSKWCRFWRQIFHYLKSTMDFDMCFKGNIQNVILGQTHFDWNVSNN